MLTKEQVEARKAYLASKIEAYVAENDPRNYQHKIDHRNREIALCDMALGYLAMQPRPLSETDGPAVLNWQGRWFTCSKQENGVWLSVAKGNPWSATDLAYPLSSLPKAGA